TMACQKEEYLKGIDQATLFAPPTAAELAAVRADWQARTLPPTAYQEEQRITLPQGAVLHFVSYRVGLHKAYGAVLLPSAASGLPVHVLINGFDLNNQVNTVNLVQSPPGNGGPEPPVLVIPALPGQSLAITANGQTYTSAVSEASFNSAFDGAADDALALLNCVLTNFPQTDASRIGVRGGSRGGTVALLMAERDRRIKRVVSVVGPTNLLQLTQSHQQDPTYQFQFLQALKSGQETIAQARQRLLASSPVYFCETLPLTQTHFGAEDKIVPPQQGEQLQARLQAMGLAGQLEYYVYAGRTHTTVASNNPSFTSRIDAFLQAL
ncbi:MAG: prolyl oligopeptidase family serine peptidase, partial [Ferruginibacter sp.]|nr:prolyl oligopeptidase family serine peptidase [Cytophagales bacterium]